MTEALLRDINALPDDVDEDIKEVLLRLANNDPTLSTCDLRFKEIGDVEMVILARALETNTVVKDLILASNKLPDSQVKVLAESLAKNKSVVKVDLSFNSITNTGTLPIIKAIQQNTTIQQVLLFHNPLDNSAMNGVTDALKSELRGKTGAAGLPEDKRAIDALQKELAAVKMERDMFRTRIEEMEKELAALRKSVGANPPAKGSALNSSMANVRPRKEKTINCENVQVMEKLAETGGSSASVFSCNVDGWNCAMKEMDLSGMHGDSAANFEGEIELLERLPFHNNICRYLFHDKRNNKLRLFMTKYASSLRKIIVERRKEVEANPPRNRYWTREEIIVMLLDVAKGLVFLHQNNVIHRDLKSDNVFVTLNERKEVNTLAIGDFDTAKRVTTVNQAKTILGTPGYIAPEVLKSNEAGGYSFKADVFSFGMVLYELLTLKLPFEDEMPFLVATQIMRGQRPPIPDHLDESYDELKDLFLKCTAFNPQQRPDMLTVKEELVKFM